MPALTVHNAEVRTATVEVKTLTVSGRQVTLAVFRQLREQTLIADSGTLNGVPWGTVNYHPDKCADTDPHWHVVWQRGTDLLRDRVTQAVTFDRLFTPPSGEAYINALAAEAPIDDEQRDLSADQVHEKIAGVWAALPVSYSARRLLGIRHSLAKALRDVAEFGADADGSWYGCPKGRRGLARFDVSMGAVARAHWQEFDDAMSAIGAGSLTELRARVEAEVRAEADRRQRHRDIRKTLADLPQLFIAV